ncbi:MAG: M48 family metalloprotease [Candidatus Cloacimonetes bacterium]|nr:M48 family metalloprotease [Candidatus Cloacimonadota bacterium]
MKRNALIVTAILLLLAALLAAASVSVLRPRSMLREGPGSYYPILTRVDEGAECQVLETTVGWYRVSWRDTIGWLPLRATQPLVGSAGLRTPRNDSLSVRITRHGMSAGAKGFAAGIARRFEGDIGVAEFLLRPIVEPTDFKAFRKASRRRYDIDSSRKPRLPEFEGSDWFSDREEITGVALASGVVAEYGLWPNATWTRYVNNVCHLVAENTDVFDVPFRVFILDIPQANAYAFPGGLILVTRGMLQSIHNEAELACVLAHEMAHVARKHGMLELQERAHHIGAEGAFAELDDEFGGFDESTSIIEQDLEDEIFKMYEYLVQGRLDDYEKEADQLACIYVLRTGYDPSVFLDLLIRLQERQSNNDHYRPELTRMRITWLRQTLRQLPERGVRNPQRWRDTGHI